jgi:hypothetical protein
MCANGEEGGFRRIFVGRRTKMGAEGRFRWIFVVSHDYVRSNRIKCAGSGGWDLRVLISRVRRVLKTPPHPKAERGDCRLSVLAVTE